MEERRARLEAVPLKLEYCHTRLATGRDAEWVAPPVGWSCDEVFMAGCQRAGYTPRIAHRSGDWQAVMGLVAADRTLAEPAAREALHLAGITTPA